MAEKDFKLAFGVDISELVSGMTQATEAVTESTAQMKGALMGVSEAFDLLSKAAFAIAGIFAGGRLFGDMITATVKLNTESRDLGLQFGVSATQASIMKKALAETFLTQEQLSAAGTRIVRTLNTNEAAFKYLDVATRDAAGNLRPLIDIVLDT